MDLLAFHARSSTCSTLQASLQSQPSIHKVTAPRLTLKTRLKQQEDQQLKTLYCHNA